MDRFIKTRSVIKNIKAISKTAGVSRTVKAAGAVTEKAAESPHSPAHAKEHNAQTYATNKVEEAADSAASQAASSATHNMVKRPGQIATGIRQVRNYTRETFKGAGKQVKAGSRSAKDAGKGVKASSRSAKRAVVATKTAVKTVGNNTKAAHTAARTSMMAARNASRSARFAIGASRAAAKAAARATSALIKLAIATAKSLASTIAAAGGTALVVIVIICLIALVAASAFGIFFSGGKTGDNNPSLREVIAEINAAHTQEIADIKRNNTYNELVLAGSRVQWKQVLAVFAVRTTTDPDEPLDVLTLDARRQKLLKDIFWDMNAIEYHITEREVIEVVLVTDDEGKPVETTQSYTVRTLHITLSGKTSDEAARLYGFSDKQHTLLLELLDARYDSTWQSVLYDLKSGSGDIVEVAIGQLGNTGGQPYWSWYGFSSRVEWCACFVSWCANECGYIEAGIMPRFSYCQTGIQWFKDAGRWQERDYVPRPGDIVFFDWGDGGDADHVGIVERCDGVWVYTIEGNSGDVCRRMSYRLDSPLFVGYGTLCLQIHQRQLY